jgi:peptidyl-prolyl cis-trans isomerase B (cyclophilin B)
MQRYPWQRRSIAPNPTGLNSASARARKPSLWLGTIAAIAALWIAGCAGQPADSRQASPPSSPNAPAATPSATPAARGLARLDGKATVVMTIKGQPVEIEVDGTNAPLTAGNFVDLVKRGVYDGLMFHRVVREPVPFVVQGGDPRSKDPKVPVTELGMSGFIDPQTGRERTIPLEIKPKGQSEPVYSATLEELNIRQPPVLNHKRGAVAMARSQFPDSASSQFYFALSDLQPLDGSYAVFGYVTKGMETIDQVQQGDRIDKASVTAGLENLKTNP